MGFPIHLGSYNTSSSRTHVRFQFSTHAAAGGNVAPSTAFENSDLRIYKAADGAAFSATQRSSASGITMTSPFDSLTGLHDVDIDLTDNTDAGFYAAGALYSVVLSPDETVDSQTITGIVLAMFEIGRPQVDVREYGGTAGTFSSGRPEVNTTHWGGTAVASANVLIDGAITAAKIADNAIDAGAIAADAITAAKIADGAIDAATFAAGAINAAAIATNAIDADALAADAVTEIQSGLATAASIAALNNISTAQVNAEVDTALADIRLDELLNADSDIDGAAPPTVGSVFHELMTKTAGSFTYDQTTDSLEAVRDNMGTAQTGDSFARLGAPAGASVSADIAGVQSDTNDIQTRLPAALTGDGNIKADALKINGGTPNDLSAAGVRTAVGLASANLDTQLDALPTAAENFAAVLTTQLTEAYAADGVAPTLAQAIFLIQQSLHEFAISGTTRTVKKLDGSTTAATFTLDSSSAPTSTTRAT